MGGAGHSGLDAGAATIPTTVVLFLFSQRSIHGRRPLVSAGGVLYLLIASGVNNAVARIASLLATAAVGTIVAGTLRMVLSVVAILVVFGGVTGLAAIRDPRRSGTRVPTGALGTHD